MVHDSHLIFEAYKNKQAKVISEMGLGAAAEGEGLGAPIHTDIHAPSDYNPPHECNCKHGKACEECEECGSSTPECEGCSDFAEGDAQQFTDTAKQQLFRIHRLSEELHELIGHHAFKPWMANKITHALADLADIYDRVDYEASVKSSEKHTQLPTELEL